jgi:hypothetical protein
VQARGAEEPAAQLKTVKNLPFFEVERNKKLLWGQQAEKKHLPSREKVEFSVSKMGTKCARDFSVCSLLCRPLARGQRH